MLTSSPPKLPFPLWKTGTLRLQKGQAVPGMCLSSTGGQMVLPLRVKLRCWALHCYSQKQKWVRMLSRVASWQSLLPAGG